MSVRSVPSRGLVLALLVSAACGDDRPVGPMATVSPRFDPTQTVDNGVLAERWLRMPFPADHRRLPDGHVDLRDFPNPGDFTVLDDWLDDAMASIDGFSTQGMVYFAFDGAIDPSTLPADAASSTMDGASAYLVDVDPTSPEYGRKVPLRSRYWPLDDLPDGYYLAHDTLALGPAWGFPLREKTTYAAVVTTAVRAADGTAIGQPRLVRALLADQASVPDVTPAVPQAQYDTLRPTWAKLRDYVQDVGVDPASIAVATVFTTQTITDELDAISSQLQTGPAPTLSSALTTYGANRYFTESFQVDPATNVTYAVYSGTYVAPNYQQGQIPYTTEGGALNFVNGEPQKVWDETIRFVLTVPDAPPDPTLGCYPIVMYGHGTGGSRNSFRNDDTAGRLAGRGMAAISIDMPLHGVRAQGMSFAVDLMTFNFYNPDSFRSNFRQGALDLVPLTRFVRESLTIAATDSHTGQAITFCDDRVSYMGHSQGGLTGALALPFLPDVDTFMLSGAGGGMGITIVNRKDIIDFAAALTASFDVPVEETLSEEHPIISLVQLHADISDPVSYARYWNRDARFRTPANVMLTSGEHDAATPYRTGTALALSAHMPILAPVVIPIPEYGLIPLATATAPISGNRNGATLGFLQFTDDIAGADVDTHFLVFNRPEAIDSSMHFLDSRADGSLPTIRRDPTADVF